MTAAPMTASWQRPMHDLFTTPVDVPRIRYQASDGYIPEYIFPEKRLTREQGIVLRELLAGLKERGATLKNGKPVLKRYEAVQWLLEAIADGGGPRDVQTPLDELAGSLANAVGIVDALRQPNQARSDSQ